MYGILNVMDIGVNRERGRVVLGFGSLLVLIDMEVIGYFS